MSSGLCLRSDGNRSVFDQKRDSLGFGTVFPVQIDVIQRVSGGEGGRECDRQQEFTETDRGIEAIGEIRRHCPDRTE